LKFALNWHPSILGVTLGLSDSFRFALLVVSLIRRLEFRPHFYRITHGNAAWNYLTVGSGPLAVNYFRTSQRKENRAVLLDVFLAFISFEEFGALLILGCVAVIFTVQKFKSQYHSADFVTAFKSWSSCVRS